MTPSLPTPPLHALNSLPSTAIAAKGKTGTPLSTEDIKEKAREKAEEFESVFLATMLDQMFEGISTEEPWGGGQAEQTYRSFLNNEYARSLSKNGGVGIADQIYTEILKMQEIDTP